MVLRLADVLHNAVFLRTRPEVAAGAGQPDRSIRWVHSTDVAEVAPLLHGGELLLTTGLGLAGADEGRRRRFVRELGEAGLGALALELGWTFTEVPADMVEEARQIALPLIVLHQIVPFVEITEALNAAIVDRSIVGLRYADDLAKTLSDALAHGAGVDELLARLSQRLSAPAILIGPDASPIAQHAPAGTTADGLIAAGGCSAAVSVDGVPFASLVVGNPGSPERDVITTALDRVSSVFALELLRSRAEVATRLQATRQLFERLTADGAPADALGRLAVAVGLPADGACYLGALVTGRVPGGAELLRQAAAQAGGQHAVTTAGDEALALIAVPSHRTAAAWDDQFAALIAGHLTAAEWPRAAVGPVVPRLADAAVSLSQARSALAAGSVVPGTGPVAVASRLLPERLLLRLPPPELDGLVTEMLGGLTALPAPRRDELLLTLEIYLANAGAKAATARQLRLQRQSLYQRLQRIRVLLGRDIDDPQFFAGLGLAVRAWRITRSLPVAQRGPAAG